MKDAIKIFSRFEFLYFELTQMRQKPNNIVHCAAINPLIAHIILQTQLLALKAPYNDANAPVGIVLKFRLHLPWSWILTHQALAKSVVLKKDYRAARSLQRFIGEICIPNA